MDFLEAGEPDFLEAGDPAQSEILSALDGIKFRLRQPVRDFLALLSVASVPPDGFTHVTGAYAEDRIKWIDLELQPCIAGKAYSLQSHEQVELSPLEIWKTCSAPLHALRLSYIVIVEALCKT